MSKKKMSYEDRINLWENQISKYKRLSFEEAKELTKRAKTNNDKELLDEVFKGTIYVVLDFVKTIPFNIVEKPLFDIDDFIANYLEEWAVRIYNYELLNVKSYKSMFGVEYTSNAANNIIFGDRKPDRRQKQDYFDAPNTYDDISTILREYINLKKEKEYVSRDDLLNIVKKYLEKTYPEYINFPGYLDEACNRLAIMIDRIYSKLNITNLDDLDISLQKMGYIQKLLIEGSNTEALNGLSYEIDNFERNYFKGLLYDAIRLGKLTEEEEKILLLYFDGRTLKDISKIIRKPKNEIDKMIEIALDKIRSNKDKLIELEDFGKDFIHK